MLDIERILLIPIRELLSATGVPSDLMLAIIGASCIIIMFLIALAIKGSSPQKKLHNKLLQATSLLKQEEIITEENVDELYSKIQDLPAPIQKGWGCFLEQRTGYPSDYIVASDLICHNKVTKRNRLGVVFFNLTSAIVITLTIWMEFLLNKGDSLMSVGVTDFTDNFVLVGAIIAAFCAPLLIFIFLKIVLTISYNKQHKKLEQSFSDFQNALDNTVIVYNGEEDEGFISENMEEINAAIKEIISKESSEKELITVATVNQDANEMFKLEVTEEAQNDNIIADETKNENIIADETKDDYIIADETPAEIEEKQRRLEGLIGIIDQAVFYDPDITKDQVEELAIMIENERLYGKHHPRDREILEECLKKLADKHTMLVAA